MIEQTVTPDTVIQVPDEIVTEFAYLASWDEIITVAADLREDRDDCSWALGDLALFACHTNISGGRPKKSNDDEDYTIASFAKSIAEDRAVVSALFWNSYFYTRADRLELPANSSWRMCAKARRNCGWTPGQPITEEVKARAIRLINLSADNSGAVAGKHSSHWVGRVKDGVVYVELNRDGQFPPDNALVNISLKA